ncbi:hypothetical protein HY418_03545 [Candidatus Kaiserbacteria bacterium]|nr:hypothetical protein [Candidatus Kaiserbacteria bacterium]
MKIPMDRMRRMTPAFRTMEALLADTTFVRHIRSDEERIANSTRESSLLAEQRAAHTATLQNIRKQFEGLSEDEKNMVRSKYGERLSVLHSIQPADAQSADSDGKESMKRLKDIEYLGKLLGFKED